MFNRISFAVRAFLTRLPGWMAAALILLGSAAPAEGDSTTDVSVTMAWDANPEPDVIGYRLYYGTAPGSYPKILDAGNSTTLTISQIAPGTYYMMVTAYNTADLESLPSTELQVVVDSAADTQSPVISDLPGEIVKVPDSPGGTSTAVSWGPPQATDNVGIASLTSTHQSGDRFPAGTTTVVYTARDAAGNQSTASFTVTVGGVNLWQQQAFGTSASDPLVAGDEVNADGDRWGNLGEYALGLQASVSDGANAFAQSLEGDQAVLHLFHNPYLPDVVLQVECSENLATGWYPVATRPPGREWTAALPGLAIATARTGNLQEVTLRDAVGNKPTAFYRLIIQRPEIQ